MPCYHLHLHSPQIDAVDEQGHDLPNLAAARTMAVEGIRGILSHEVVEGRMDLRGQVDIADDVGVILETVLFVDGVAIVTLA